MTNREIQDKLRAALLRAVETGDQERISEAIYNGAEFLHQHVEGFSEGDMVLLLLTVCAFRQHTEMAELLTEGE